jgi:arabinofuranosyltransferase
VQTPSGTWHRALTGLLVVAGLGLFATQFPSLPNFSIDDAYITFSFSKNVALGNGPVFSHGARVEGYSNFLWMMLVALPLAVRSTLSPVLVARCLCAPFAVLLFYAVYRTLRSVTGSRAWAVLGLALLAG